MKPITVLVSVDSNSVLMGARHFLNYFRDLVKEHNLEDTVDVLETGSMGIYPEGVIVSVLPDGVFYVVRNELM